jgi:hypothetical protein
MEWTRDNFSVTCDPAKLDRALIAQFLSSSYGASGIPPDTVTKSVGNSLCFGLFDQERQIGFVRVISDYATVAYLGDAFVPRQADALEKDADAT